MCITPAQTHSGLQYSLPTIPLLYDLRTPIFRDDPTRELERCSTFPLICLHHVILEFNSSLCVIHYFILVSLRSYVRQIDE